MAATCGRPLIPFFEMNQTVMKTPVLDLVPEYVLEQLAPEERRAFEEAMSCSPVLEGTLLLEGRTWHAGDILEADAGSSHTFTATPGRDLVIIVGHDGIVISPRDPITLLTRT